MLDFKSDSDSTNFFIPEFGYNTVHSATFSYGIAVYGNGGMNTDYPNTPLNCVPFGGYPVANGLCGDGRLGVDLTQLIIAPTFAWKLTPDHAIGISPALRLPALRGQGRAALHGALAEPGERDQQRLRQLHGLGREDRLHGARRRPA